ncbi:hypothetical protein T484DRAFT_2955333 [Baffinella frigidus]|nr:hypothetical protein T484DRAFT_2955333 [Cryptophyta sp. CCMP2293]
MAGRLRWGCRVVRLVDLVGSLEVRIPAAGVTGSTVAGGAFSIAWGAGVGTWTVAALTGAGPLMAAFSIPFWLAGGKLVKDTVKDAAVASRLTISDGRFEIVQKIGEREIGRVEGEARDLSQCEVETVGYVNGVPIMEVQLVEGVNARTLGPKASLQPAEQEWIASRVRAFLNFT